jgi:hypothetical protein
MLALEPKRRPRPERAAAALRRTTEPSEEAALPVAGAAQMLPRALHAGLAGVFTLAAALLLPFFPTGWPFLLGGLAALAAFANPSAGLALALAAPLLPLGNSSLGLALAYVPLALVWYLLFSRDPRSGLLFVLGPLLAPLGALALAPALVSYVRSPARRALLAAFAVLTAVAAAALLGSPAPLTGEASDVALGLGAATNPGEATAAVAGALGSHPALWIEALVFAAAAATTGLARSRGLPGVALWGAAFLAAALLAPAGAVGVFPLALAALGAAALLAIPALKAVH